MRIRYINTFYLEIADCVFEITSEQVDKESIREWLPETIKRLYENFLISKPKKIHYQLRFLAKKQSEVLLRRKDGKYFIELYSHPRTNIIISHLELSVAEFQIIIKRLISDYLSTHTGFSLHASANDFNGIANMFIGDSTAGKSTIMTLLHQKYPGIADDSLIIKKVDKQFFMYQTPYLEYNYWFTRNKEKRPVGNIFFLHKSIRNKAVKIQDTQRILKQLTRNAILNQEDLQNQLASIIEFIQMHNFFDLYFSKDTNAIINTLTSL